MHNNFLITTPKTVLREVKMTDDKKVFEAIACPEIHSMHSNGFRDISDVCRYISVLLQEYNNGIFRTLAVAEKSSNELCGTITIDIHKLFPRAELGYWISMPYRNKGYASEAVAAIVEYGLSTLNLKRIQAVHDINNPASGRVLEKAGMICEGVLRQYNGYSDEKIYSVVISDVLNSGCIRNNKLKIFD